MSHASDRLQAIRNTYEPYLAAIGVHVLIDLPPWLPADDAEDNWETTAWDFNSPAESFAPNGPFRIRGKQAPPDVDVAQHGTDTLHLRPSRESDSQPNDA